MNEWVNEWMNCTFLNVWINVEGLAPWVDTTVPVELLTQGQRSVFSICHLVRQVPYGQVL